MRVEGAAAARPKLLIVDDEESIRTQLQWALAKRYDILVAADRKGALEVFRAGRPEVVILDLGLPPSADDVAEGLAVLEEMCREDDLVKVIVSSGHSERENALEAIGRGAYDFLPKPVQVDELKLILARAFHVSRLEREYRALQQRVAARTFEGMLGTSPRMQEVFAAIRKVATTDAPGARDRARTAPARSWRRAPSTGPAPGPAGRSSRSTAARSPRASSRASCSGTRRARSPAPTSSARAASSSAARRDALPRRDRRAPGAAAGQAAALPAGAHGSSGSAGASRSRSTCASSPPRTATSKTAIARGAASARTSTTASAWSRSRCRRCATGTGDIPLLAKTLLQRFSADAGRKLPTFTPQALRGARAPRLARERPGAGEPRPAGGDHGGQLADHAGGPGLWTPPPRATRGGPSRRSGRRWSAISSGGRSSGTAATSPAPPRNWTSAGRPCTS